MSEHVQVIRKAVTYRHLYPLMINAYGGKEGIEFATKLSQAADHLERCEAALRASTELLRKWQLVVQQQNGPLVNQIAANEAALKGGK